MAGGFEQWQSDAFFAAAEEVQESADLLESLYRAWLTDRSSGVSLHSLEGLERDLRRALGTAKWQLEQFERAINQSYHSSPNDPNAMLRRRQFVEALENQIHRVEREVNSSFVEERKQEFHWVNLDEEERDDLVAFLSAPRPPVQQTKRRSGSPVKDKSRQIAASLMSDGSKDRVAACTAPSEKVESRSVLPCNDGIGSRDKTLSVAAVLSVDSDCSIKIDIADGDSGGERFYMARPEITKRQSSLLCFLHRVEFMMKLKWFRNGLSKAKNEDCLPLTNGHSDQLDSRGSYQFAQRLSKLTERSRNCLGRHSDWTGWMHQSSKYDLLIGLFIRVVIMLLLIAILIVPLWIYSR